MTRTRLPLVPWLSFVLGLGSALLAPLARADVKRPLALPAGQLRVDLGPSDYGFMDHGWLNDDRGLRIAKPGDGDLQARFGVGGGYGITPDFEVGGLLLPIWIAPDGDFGDVEAYGRYTFLQGPGSVGAQVTVQVPTNADFGLGIGLPFMAELSSAWRIEGGVELEILFDVDRYLGRDIFNIDVPLAFNYFFDPQAFAGFRSGFLMVDTEDAQINLGAQGGFEVAPDVVLSGSFNWPAFIWTGPGDTLNVDYFEFIFGANFYVAP